MIKRLWQALFPPKAVVVRKNRQQSLSDLRKRLDNIRAKRS